MDVGSVALGKEGSVDLKLSGGKLIVQANHAHASGDISLSISEDAGYFLDKLAALIPGTFDDAIIAIAKDAIKKLP